MQTLKRSAVWREIYSLKFDPKFGVFCLLDLYSLFGFTDLLYMDNVAKLGGKGRFLKV